MYFFSVYLGVLRVIMFFDEFSASLDPVPVAFPTWPPASYGADTTYAFSSVCYDIKDLTLLFFWFCPIELAGVQICMHQNIFAVS